MGAIDLAHVTKRFDDGTVAVHDLSLSVAEGEFMILVGPSGCGKTTALRMIAGLEEATEGTIRIGGREVAHLPPSRRDIAMVFQNYALYPHMTVRDNIGFPLRKQRLSRKERQGRVEEVARLLAIEDLLDRKPRALSGGQRQRVAMGRAIIRRPQAFLMDEPLSNLDAKLRVQMRAELLSLHQSVGITTIYVTHDQTEAMTLGDRVVVMNKGIVQQVDAPERLYRKPVNAFVAGFIGSPAMNFLRGELTEEGVQLGPHRVPLPETLKRVLTRRTGDVVVGLRPEDFVLTAANDNEGEAVIPAEVQITEHLGPEVLLHFRADGLQIASTEAAASLADEVANAPIADALVARVDPAFHGARGDRVRVRISRERMQLFDPASGESLLRG